ncbi:MAG: NADH-quinone oxidoreductase subunit L [Actinomycetota bacterium]|nr:NADH-quinone oxidoreductase subunit L [Actinomycetota bacterium]
MTLWLLVAVPSAGALLAALAPRRATVIAAGTIAAVMAVGIWAAATEASSIVSWGPRLELTLAAAGFSRVMVVLVPVIALPIVLYAAATETTGRVRLIALLTVFVGAMELLVAANDLLTLLIGWELVGALSWVLIAHEWNEVPNAQKAAHAFITTRLGDLGLYISAGIAFAATGSFGFSDIAQADSPRLQIVAAGIVVAAAAKSAQVPFSPWLFSAMAGPTPVSALLHSSTMVAAGAYLLVRLGSQLDSVTWFSPVVIAIGLTSALAGGIVAAVHRHPKRLLAASTTAQYGLMFVAIGAGSIVAAAAQLVTHAAFKSLLFLTAGTAMHVSGSDDLDDMRLGGRLPTIAAIAAIGGLALAALPPLGGAWSKEQIVGAAFEFSPLLGVAVLAAALLGAFYALRYWVLAFGPGSATPKAAVPTQVKTPVGFLAALSVGLGVLWIPAASESTGRLLPGEVVPTRVPELALGLAALVIAAGLVVALRRRALLVEGFLAPTMSKIAAEWFGIATASRRVMVDPVLGMARALAAFDDRVIDAGVRASTRIADAFSSLLRRRSELSLDALVNGVGSGTLFLATGTRVADDSGVDRAVEGVARSLGWGGELLRRLQTGLTHHYYVIVAIGLIAAAAVLALGAS